MQIDTNTAPAETDRVQFALIYKGKFKITSDGHVIKYYLIKLINTRDSLPCFKLAKCVTIFFGN